MRGLTKSESRALAEIAKSFGYLATRGPTTKGGAEVGNPIEFILAIISGEVAPLLLETDHIPNVADEMERHAAAIGGYVGEDLASIAAQLRSAARRYAEATAE